MNVDDIGGDIVKFTNISVADNEDTEDQVDINNVTITKTFVIIQEEI